MTTSKAAVLALLLAAAGTIPGIAGIARADMLLVDPFDNGQISAIYAGNPVGTGDYGVNQELANRQSGLLAPVAYNRRTATEHGGPANTHVNRWDLPGTLAFSALNLYNPYAVLAHGFVADVQVTADVAPVVGDTASPNWISLSLRGQSDVHTGTVPLSATSGVSFLMKANGTWSVIQNGDLGGAIFGAVAAAEVYSLSLSVVDDVLSGTVNGASIGSIPLVGAAAGEDNYISLSGFSAGATPEWHTVEDLGISTIEPVPEPASLALLGVAALVATARRRRRSA